ncbi:MAG: hypothetical protein ACHQNT_00770 [Bacteroidia bacterium]
MKAILTSAFCMLLSLTIFSSTYAQNRESQTMSLEGKSFKITLENRANPAQVMTDEISFKDRNFDSQNARQTGFKPEGYLYKPAGEMGDYFEFRATSEKEGTKIWNGYIKNGEVSGGMIVEKPGQPAEKYPFKGTVSTTQSK